MTTMAARSPDTDPAVEAMLFKAYRHVGPAGCARRAAELRDAALAMAAAVVRVRHPGIRHHELRVRVAARAIDRDLLARAFSDIELDGARGRPTPDWPWSFCGWRFPSPDSLERAGFYYVPGGSRAG